MVGEARKRRHGGPPVQGGENRFANDWLVYLALLPAVLASIAIGITAAVTLGTASSWHHPTSQAAGLKVTPPQTDDYVGGLAKIGIAKIPGYDPADKRYEVASPHRFCPKVKDREV